MGGLADAVAGRDRTAWHASGVNCGERDEPTIAVDRLLEGLAGLLVVEGALGLGKSHLVRRASGQAAQRGWEVVSVAGSSATPAVPFAPWAHVLDEVPIDATPAALVAVALARLRGLRARSPVLVAIDDLDRLDELSWSWPTTSCAARTWPS